MGDLPSATLSAAKITGTNSNAFTIPNGMDGCQGAPVGAKPCTVTVLFTPQFTGPHAATLELHDASVPPLATAALSGTGTPAWTREYSAASTSPSRGFLSVFAAGAHAYAVGVAGAFVTRNSDGSWTKFTIDSNDYALITGSGPADLWIASANKLVKSSGNGIFNTPNGLFNLTINGVIAFAPNDVWALASTKDDPPIENLYHSASSDFTQTNATVDRGTGALWGLSSSKLYAADSVATCVAGSCNVTLSIVSGDATNGFTKTEDSLGTFAFPRNPPLGPIWGSSATDIYCGSLPALHSAGDGVWSAVDPSSGPGALGVWGSSATDVFFVTPSGIYRGSGSTWTKVVFQSNGFQPYGVWGTGPNDVYVVGIDKDGYSIFHWN
jgi:hypothetical protein